MKLLTVLTIITCFILSATAQQPLKVIKKGHVINEVPSIGRAIDLKGKGQEINDALGRFLKEYGKTRSTSDYYWTVSPYLGGVAYDGNVLYASTEGDETKGQVWIGIDTAGWRGSDFNKVMAAIEKMVYQFGVQFYRDQIQKEIDESQVAFDATEKQKLRLVNQSKDINLKMANNDQERLHLEKSLTNNKLEKAVLIQKLANNKKSQDSVTMAGLQIKKVMEAQKLKQQKVN
jgi:hypothetical protein